MSKAKLSKKQPVTVRDQIAFSYANLARAHSALNRGAEKYATVDHMVGARLRRGLLDGSMKMGSLYDDERFKMTMPQACYYCGSKEKLSMDHLIPRIRGGNDTSHNLVWACRSCNSSKGGRDMLEWMAAKDRFPPILLLRRYIKIVAEYCERRDWLDLPLERIGDEAGIPFDIRLLPIRFPPLSELILWTEPTTEDAGRREIPDDRRSMR